MDNMYKYDFQKFVIEHQKQIFGRDTTMLGLSISSSYKKQINALNIKMNEVVNAYGIEDKKFLLGLFGLAVNQFGHNMKSDISDYEDDFYKFLEGEDQ